jgi:hypothetical protein
MQIPSVTQSQRRILFYLSSFRFLLISHFQHLFHHKDPHRIKEWLIDLEKKKLIAIIKDPKDKTKPYIICLNQKARSILKKDSAIDKSFLNRLYKEKQRDEKFINQHLYIADTYLYFLSHKDKKTQLDFFTMQDLAGYAYFPDPMPDAYIDETVGREHHRYFLNFFDAGTSPAKVSFYVGRYFKYREDNNWEENTENEPFPAILLVFKNERRKKFAYYYSKALLKKAITFDIEIFLTTYDQMKISCGETNIWQQVDTEE